MPSYVPPKYATAYIFYVVLVDQSNTKLFKSSPTLATGDVKISIDGGALANLATLPVVTPAAGRRVKVSLSSAEMTGDNIGVLFNDASGAEWCDLFVNIQTSARQVDDLAYPAVSGRSTAIDASGQVSVGALAANIITPTAIQNDAITAAKIADGAIDAATFAAGAINAAAIAADAITDAKVASDVTIASVTGAVGSVTGAVGSVTGNVGGNVVGSVASVTAGVTVTTNNDKTGYGLSSAAIQAIWDALTSALTTVGSIGKRIADNLDAVVTSRMATFVYATPPTAVQVRTEMDSNSTQLAAIVADSNELQLELADGGRTDLLIDGIKTKTDLIPAAPAAVSNIPTVANILAGVVEGGITLKGALRLTISALTGKASGGGTNTVAFRDTDDTKARITATVDPDGNRTAVSRDITD